MKTWDDISIFKFQEIERINQDKSTPEDDKPFLVTCAVFDLMEDQLNNMTPKKALKKINRVAALFNKPFKDVQKRRIGPYVLSYDPSTLTFGQYIELSFFLQEPIHRAHFALASITHKWGRSYKTDGHRERAEYFQDKPVALIMGCLKAFMENFRAFNEEYKFLFGLDKEMYEPQVQSDRFNRRYGWIYSAGVVAEYERITLGQAYALPIRQALNDLAYLKEKSRYDAEQRKQAPKK